MTGEHFDNKPCVQELTREGPVRGHLRDGGCGDVLLKDGDMNLCVFIAFYVYCIYAEDELCTSNSCSTG